MKALSIFNFLHALASLTGLALLSNSSAQPTYREYGFVKECAFAEAKSPPKPDYSQDSSWGALPWKRSDADTIPLGTQLPEKRKAMVFWVSPTLYMGPSDTTYPWNANTAWEWYRKENNKSPLRYQASAFNAAGQIYSPLYRQAHLYSFYAENRADGLAALQLAYSDVRDAFLHFLKHFRKNNEPIILAGHSQGAYHIALLLMEFFDGTPLQNELVAAYFPGMPVPLDSFNVIKPCSGPDELHCMNSWATYARGYYPPTAWKYPRSVAVNPLSWTTDTVRIKRQENPGSILWRYGKVRKRVCDAQLHRGMVWIRRPRFPGSIFLNWKEYHIADINLFYMSIRKNAQNRVNLFYEQRKQAVD
jgi:hypothetical protein